MPIRDKALLPNARKLRKAMTPEESHLWYDYLRKYPVRFRRQEIIGEYIADFYCSRAQVIIELDGSQHYEKAEAVDYDKKRTAFIESLGILVLRFTNYDLHRNFEGICAEIDRIVKKRIAGV